MANVAIVTIIALSAACVSGCGSPVSKTPDTINGTEDEQICDPHFLGVLFENSGSLVGYHPEELGKLYVDYDGDGQIEGERDRLSVLSRASDGAGRRSNVPIPRHAFDELTPHSGCREMGIWSFTVEDGVDSWVAEETGETWTSDQTQAVVATARIPSPEKTRANVYESMEEVIASEFGDVEGEKTLIVFVDGPDDLRDLEAPDARDVRLFIVHLDSEIDVMVGETPLLRDDFAYWKNQEPCRSEDQCEGFETCVVPHGYSTQWDGAVAPEYDAMGETYCLPRRDPQTGRVGKIAPYHELGCRSGGAYIYVDDPNALDDHMTWIPYVVYGGESLETWDWSTRFPEEVGDLEVPPGVQACP